MNCIFGSASQFASIRYMAPDWFARLLAYEKQFGCTIKRSMSLEALADRGQLYRQVLERPDLVRAALSDEWRAPIRCTNWQLPAGAFGERAGPT